MAIVLAFGVCTWWSVFITLRLFIRNILSQLIWNIHVLLGICFSRGALEGAIEGIGDGEKGGCFRSKLPSSKVHQRDCLFHFFTYQNSEA
ncbi:MAG: hypothetical protein ACI9DF_005615 [Verrucomicrobiales bacterium]|jgi:hypothetical protein